EYGHEHGQHDPRVVDGGLLGLRGPRAVVRGRHPLRRLRPRVPSARTRDGGGVADNRPVLRAARAPGLLPLGPPAEREMAEGAGRDPREEPQRRGSDWGDTRRSRFGHRSRHRRAAGRPLGPDHRRAVAVGDDPGHRRHRHSAPFRLRVLLLNRADPRPLLRGGPDGRLAYSPGDRPRLRRRDGRLDAGHALLALHATPHRCDVPVPHAGGVDTRVPDRLPGGVVASAAGHQDDLV
ncbi:MAG: hypothetical protein AVDCRST_MAG01-01-4919, partial [uncultured Rubrobacteraceae bacterium]